MSDFFSADINSREVLSRIDRNQAEVRKLLAEAAKLTRDRSISVWQVAITGMGAGAAIFGAGAAFWKVLEGP